MGDYVRRLMADVTAKNANEPEFLQAVREAAGSLELCLDRFPEYREARVLERFVEPERVVTFRVAWADDRGEVHVNRGYRVEMSSAIGPYKGGLRFHPTVYVGMLKFLAFEQVFKNALTTLAARRRQGRRRLRPEGQERARGDALLPGVHDRAVSPHRVAHRRAGGRHRRRGAGARIPLRAVQAHHERVHGRDHRQGPRVGRLPDPARGDGVRRGLLRAGDAGDPRRLARGQDLHRERGGQRRAVHGREAARTSARSRSPCRTPAGSSTTPTASTRRSSRG